MFLGQACPELTGRGLGVEFVRAGVEFARSIRLHRVILDVASFNKRAIKVYERVGFRETGKASAPVRALGEVEFVDMELQQ